MTPTDFLETKEAVEMLHRAPQTLRMWASQGTGPIRPVRVNGWRSRLLWSRAEIERLLSGIGNKNSQ